MAAENYAKATNNLGVAMVTTGPGGTNAITGVAGAWLDSTPMLFISGQVKRPDRMFAADGTPLGMRQLGVQEVDIVSIVKAGHQVRGDGPRSRTAFATTWKRPCSWRAHGRPGPVWIDIPLDVQAAPIDETDLPAFDPAEMSASFDFAELVEKVRETIAALNRAERPLIFVGNGVRLAQCRR